MDTLGVFAAPGKEMRLFRLRIAPGEYAFFGTWMEEGDVSFIYQKNVKQVYKLLHRYSLLDDWTPLENTVRKRPVGDSDPFNSMYAKIKIAENTRELRKRKGKDPIKIRSLKETRPDFWDQLVGA